MEAVDEKAHRISVENEDPTDMLASQQALELRKFFEPFDPSRPDDFDYGHINPAINKDGALDAYTENIVWRLGGVRAMVTVQDRKIQYFLAGTTRRPGSDHVEIESEDAWFGCKTTDIHDGLWEHTAQINTLEADYPCFIVPDLSKDQRFASMQMVDGSVSSYRFYAGAPITTPQGVNIGTVFMFDNEPRPGGLSSRQRKSLHDAAGHVMKHLETVRDAAERRRVVLMSKGIATFLERTAGVVEEASLHGPRLPVAPRTAVPDPKAFPIDPPAPSNQLQESRKSVSSPGTADGESESILAKIKLTLEHAAEILKDSLELSAGGVVFVDTSSSHSEAGPRDAYFDIDTDIGAELEETKGSGDLELKLEAEKELNVSEEKISQPKSRFSGCVLNGRSPPAKVLSICSAAVAKMEPGAEVLDGKTLQTLINVYPNGNVWYIDQSGYFSSLEQLNVFHESEQTKSKRETSGTSPSFDVIRQRAEANLLSKTFQKARQIIFLPLWDARGSKSCTSLLLWDEHD
ncbi:MAG: hypothetical protein M1818_000357 [Claussenomyces sp. TS43310]|nr:MAG: hypothetical protein M1818_000357 [Claussenomyces sp. TS43310]